MLLNSIDFAVRAFGEGPDVDLIPPMGENSKNRLFESLKTNNDATLMIDSELITTQQSRYQDLEGLRIAYECRTHPTLKFRGYIKLFGFFPLFHVKENRFGGLLRGGERIHARDFTLKGASYFRYPNIDINEEPPLSEEGWGFVGEELDEIFIQQVRRFEHGFRNVIIASGMNTEERKEKKAEMESHLATLAQIEKTTVIQQRYRSSFDSIRANLRSVTNSFALADDSELGEILSKIKSEVHDLREQIVTVGR
jgi:hypothetical protein